jgi:hypothetical protein
VVIFFTTNDTAKAEDFVASRDLKNTMAKTGVVDRPTFYFLESAVALCAQHRRLLDLIFAQEANHHLTSDTLGIEQPDEIIRS